MFSVNMTFDKTLMMQFCYFLQNRHFLGYKMCKYSKPNLNTFARSPVTVSWVCTNVLLCSSLAQKYSTFEYLQIYSPKSGDFCRKNSKITSLTFSQRKDLRKTLKYSQSRDLEAIQWILSTLWIYTDAAPENICSYKFISLLIRQNKLR